MHKLFSRLSHRYSRTVWLLTTGRFVDQTTLWMSMPFMAIFVNRAGASAGLTGPCACAQPDCPSSAICWAASGPTGGAGDP